MDEGANPILSRLEDQIHWYDLKSLASRKAYQWSEFATLGAAALLPFAVTVRFPAWLIAGIGCFILLLRGLATLQQYQVNWISYRSTCESLKHEKYLFLAGAGPYADAPSPERLLAERVEGMVAREHAESAGSMEQAVNYAAHSSAFVKESRETLESDADDRPVGDELVKKVFEAIKTGRVSGWEVASSVAEDPGIVKRALNVLRRRGLIDSNGIGLDGYYYLTSQGFSTRASIGSGR